MALEKGIWFRNALNGNFYEGYHDISCISCVVVDGKYFYPSDKNEQANPPDRAIKCDHKNLLYPGSNICDDCGCVVKPPGR